MKWGPKAPKLQLRALHVTTAGRSIVKVTPANGLITIGDESWKVGRMHLFPGKGAFDVVVVSGQSEALPVWERSPLSGTEVDSLAHDDLLRQIRDLSQGGKTNAVNWIQVGISALLILCIVGVGFKLNGDLADLQKSIEDSHPQVAQVGNGQPQGGVTVTQGNPNPGTLGQLNDGGSGPP